MSRKIPADLRKQVSERAGLCCEYCHFAEEFSFDGFQIDHIVSIKHGGNTDPENLAYSCPDCNRYKGSDVGTYLAGQEHLTRLFNPRKDHWVEHFDIFEGAFYAKTDVGQATISLLRLNDPDRIIIRQEIAKIK
jgi:hypothetical protein